VEVLNPLTAEQPIQRICRYPLLFSELLKYTPVCDCPNSHMEIENVLIRLREVTAEINRATDDPQIKTTLEQTWLLQDRLIFPRQVRYSVFIASTPADFIRRSMQLPRALFARLDTYAFVALSTFAGKPEMA
jgi:hypothetical protein